VVLKALVQVYAVGIMAFESYAVPALVQILQLLLIAEAALMLALLLVQFMGPYHNKNHAAMLVEHINALIPTTEIQTIAAAAAMFVSMMHPIIPILPMHVVRANALTQIMIL